MPNARRVLFDGSSAIFWYLLVTFAIKITYWRCGWRQLVCFVAMKASTIAFYWRKKFAKKQGAEEMCIAKLACCDLMSRLASWLSDAVLTSKSHLWPSRKSFHGQLCWTTPQASPNHRHYSDSMADLQIASITFSIHRRNLLTAYQLLWDHRYFPQSEPLSYP